MLSEAIDGPVETDDSAANLYAEECNDAPMSALPEIFDKVVKAAPGGVSDLSRMPLFMPNAGIPPPSGVPTFNASTPVPPWMNSSTSATADLSQPVLGPAPQNAGADYAVPLLDDKNGFLQYHSRASFTASLTGFEAGFAEKSSPPAFSMSAATLVCPEMPSVASNVSASSAATGADGAPATDSAIDLLQPLREHLTSSAFTTGRALRGLTTPVVTLNTQHTLPGSELYSRFVTACRVSAARSPTATVHLVFHGTSDENISPICEAGLDPAKRGSRHGQAHGEGEYFGTLAWTSLGYCRDRKLWDASRLDDQPGAQRMLVFAVLVDQPHGTALRDTDARDIATQTDQPQTDQPQTDTADAVSGSGSGSGNGSGSGPDGKSLSRRERRDLGMAAALSSSAARRRQAPCHYIVIQQPERHIPLGVLSWHDVTSPQVLQSAAELAMAARLAAEAAQREAERASAVLRDAERCAKVQQFLIRDDIQEASELYQASHTYGGESCGGESRGPSRPPPWAAQLYPLLAPRVEALGEDLLACLFPSAFEIARAPKFDLEPVFGGYRPGRVFTSLGGRCGYAREHPSPLDHGASDGQGRRPVLPPTNSEGGGSSTSPAVFDETTGFWRPSAANASAGVARKRPSTAAGKRPLGASWAAAARTTPFGGESVEALATAAKSKRERAVSLQAAADSATASASGTIANGSAPTAVVGAPQTPQAPLAAARSAATAWGGEAAAPATPAATRKIMAELRTLASPDAVTNVTCWLPDDADCYVWRVDLSTPSGSDLAAELDAYARRVPGAKAAVSLEVRFDGLFPSSPPFVRVVSPRFAFHTGHVTVGGSLCMAELTSAAWDPAVGMERLLNLVHSALLCGNAQIDKPRAHIPYTLAEARAAFTRVARQHGWA